MDNVKITLLVITFINTLHALVLLRTHSSLGWPCEPRTDYVEVTMFSNKTYSSKICETKSQSDNEWQSSDQGLIKILAIPWYISNSKEVSWRQSIFHMEKTLSNDADNKQRIFRRRVTWSGQLYSRWYVVRLRFKLEQWMDQSRIDQLILCLVPQGNICEKP